MIAVLFARLQCFSTWSTADTESSFLLTGRSYFISSLLVRKVFAVGGSAVSFQGVLSPFYHTTNIVFSAYQITMNSKIFQN